MDRRRFVASLLTALGAPLVGCRQQEGPPRTDPTGDPAVAPPTSEPSPEQDVGAAPSPSASPAPTAARGVELAVICRRAWRADEPGELTTHTVRQLTLHHDAVVLEDDRDAPDRIRQHQDHHRSLGWPDIAYHLAVDRRGHVYELRPPDTAGDTGTEYDPEGHFLVVALGDYTRQEPTEPQLEGIVRAFAWGATTFDVAPDSLTGHRDHARTACPGEALQRRLPELRERIDAVVDAGVERRDICGTAGEELVAAIGAGSDDPLGD